MSILQRKFAWTALALGLLAGAGVVLESSSIPVAAAAIPDGAVFVPIDPQRLLDTRDGTGLRRVARIAASSTTIVPVTGTVVPEGAVGVILNLTTSMRRATDSSPCTRPTSPGRTHRT